MEFIQHRRIFTHKVFMIVGVIFTFACGQYPAEFPEEEVPFDSSEILADIIVKSAVPVLIDFWATWCMPCRMLSPTIDDLKKKYAGKIKVMKINVDVHRKISAYFRVSSIPAIFLVKDRAVVLYLPGLRPKEDYESAIKEVLAKKTSLPDTAQQKPSQKKPLSLPVK